MFIHPEIQTVKDLMRYMDTRFQLKQKHMAGLMGVSEVNISNNRNESLYDDRFRSTALGEKLFSFMIAVDYFQRQNPDLSVNTLQSIIHNPCFISPETEHRFCLIDIISQRPGSLFISVCVQKAWDRYRKSLRENMESYQAV